MSFFQDKTWDEMDWLNKAVEPYVFSFNEDFAKIPSEWKIPSHYILNMYANNHSIALRDLVVLMMNYNKLNKLEQERILQIECDKLFKIQVSDEAYIDPQAQTMVGEIFLIKKDVVLDDEFVSNILQNHVMKTFNSYHVPAERVNEVMDILNCKETRSSSSVRKKIYGLRRFLVDLFADNKWNIRNVDLAMKMVTWTFEYCQTGDRQSLANLSKLKCMVHNGHPIYSMQEVL